MSINRRQALTGGAALLVSAAVGSPGAREGAGLASSDRSSAVAALAVSPLIYLTPLLPDGRESRCHGEVWFVHRDEDIFVCTWADKWRAKAMRRGYRRARIWIGDYGTWARAEDRYRSAPTLEIEGRFENDPVVQAALLGAFADKYTAEWGAWDQRIRDGFANGGWVLLRYRVVS